MSLYRYDPPLGSMTADAMRLASGGPVVCRTCGCRLEAPTTAEMDEDPAGSWRHFEGLPGRDARGCRVVCVDLDHGMDGYVIS